MIVIEAFLRLCLLHLCFLLELYGTCKININKFQPMSMSNDAWKRVVWHEGGSCQTVIERES